MTNVSRKPLLRVRKPGALFFAALIALLGTMALPAANWRFLPILLIPFAVLVWSLRAGTDVAEDGLTVRALLGAIFVPWTAVRELAPDPRGRISALLTDGRAVPLTGVTTANLARVLAAGGQEVSSPPTPD
ncbi:PH domain-containing protein [Actinoplanes sp. NPDC051859]|uniref:PH domain-containing protein n=1 Tax=Actinoplanes sp. NPDC051859 TaxID=3363909 RepID=UPI0037A2C0B6